MTAPICRPWRGPGMRESATAIGVSYVGAMVCERVILARSPTTLGQFLRAYTEILLKLVPPMHQPFSHLAKPICVYVNQLSSVYRYRML